MWAFVLYWEFNIWRSIDFLSYCWWCVLFSISVWSTDYFVRDTNIIPLVFAAEVTGLVLFCCWVFVLFWNFTTPQAPKSHQTQITEVLPRRGLALEKVGTVQVGLKAFIGTRARGGGASMWRSFWYYTIIFCVMSNTFFFRGGGAVSHFPILLYAGGMGRGAAEATGLGFVCFVVSNPRVPANRVDFGFFLFINFPILPPPPDSNGTNIIRWSGPVAACFPGACSLIVENLGS